jgi:glycolate oxidase FAD binding subunit
MSDEDCLTTHAGLLPTQVGSFLEEVESLARDHGLRVESDARAGLGAVYCRWRSDSKSTADAGSDLVSSLQRAAARLQGRIIVEGCPAALKPQISVWGDETSDFALMRRIKEELDPKRTLSPGRFVGGL